MGNELTISACPYAVEVLDDFKVISENFPLRFFRDDKEKKRFNITYVFDMRQNERTAGK